MEYQGGENKAVYSELNINNGCAIDGVNIDLVGKRMSILFSLNSTLNITVEIDADTYEGAAIVLLTYPW